MMITGVERVRGSPLICASTSRPSTFGMFRSSSMTHGLPGGALRVHAFAEHEVQRRLAVLHPHDLLADAADLERADRQLRVGRIVVGKQDVAGPTHSSPPDRSFAS